jgi:hypothetical protein
MRVPLMKILFFTSSIEDYLADPALHGLRLQYGKDCIDYPKCEILYRNCPEQIRKQVRGNGFTLYTGLLDDIEIDRFNIEDKIVKGYFDLIIISDIWRQFGWFVHFRPWLTPKNCIILDSADTTQPYPAHGRWWRKPYYWFLPRVHPYFLYFKREWVPDTHFSILARLFPKIIRERLPQPRTLRRVSFAIPEEKIIDHLPDKKKDFPKHIVDPEVAARVAGSHTSYAFTSENEYYKDLQESRFGITTKRAGWDCLRHYEIAANGAVMCFRDFDLKPETCAPHGLTSENAIFYKNAEELMTRISAMSQQEYRTLQQGSLKWIKSQTSIELAKKIMGEVNLFHSVRQALD